MLNLRHTPLTAESECLSWRALRHPVPSRWFGNCSLSMTFSSPPSYPLPTTVSAKPGRAGSSELCWDKAFSISARGGFEGHPICGAPGCSEPDCHCLQAPGGVTEAERALERDGVFQGLIQRTLGTLQRWRIHHPPRQRCLCSPASRSPVSLFTRKWLFHLTPPAMGWAKK